MTVSQEQWGEIEGLRGSILKARIFSILQETAHDIQTRDVDDPEVLNVVPRLAHLIETREELASYREAFGALARAVGLWNYIDKDTADYRDAIVADAVTAEELGGITFHREQIGALNTLLSGRNLVLSAPTSFGKNLLIDALLATNRYRRVAIVLPTIALLDEFRRRIERRFQDKFTLIMYHSQEAPSDGNVIFLGTQERLLHRPDLGRLDLAVVDEFYKLDPSRHDDRSSTLNAAVYQLLRRSNQFFFLGPNIETVRYSADNRWKFEFLHTRFATVAVDTFDLRRVQNKSARLTQELQQKKNWPALVFISSPDRANKLASDLVKNNSFAAVEASAQWISENFGENWELSKAVAKGVAVHHGRIPRSLASHFVRLFNTGEIPVLICTSTLIEGVNTAAKSVLIFDKSINRRDYDFFTFSNIRGRAGRLGQHHIGAVYLFHAPPDQETIEVEPPLFGDLDEAPDELVVHISDEDTSEAISDRVAELARTMDLTQEELRLASSVGLEDAIALKQQTEAASRHRAHIHWNRFPRYDEILAVANIICSVRRPSEFGCKSAAQLAVYLSNLRSHAMLKGFFLWHSSSYQGDPSGYDGVFRFLRACEYGLPQLFAVVEMFAKRQNSNTSYSLYLAEMPRWFRAEVLKNLDEQGVPVQISERFLRRGDSIDSLRRRLLHEASNPRSALTSFERQWVVDALQV
ncbi:helicase-related protein [Rhodoplanes sp. TEM]|uniref:Helicase-related protein n=1 Tax=Rhodoplanes tepidamans TaxID=200616 RepID=A0ABT5JKJ4_RHOTP|nr:MULTISPECIES: DEAD/DEAH box helicase [Rhodoplanes]MDC7789500.1 helicase-related protein [Rhodoplanes tepidamans]MDC7987479.1 helicase-related protein [Rhodoplanes sp. TEM]MDQ0359124.1 late competence protein required for DNA uptake (superfamily II DNA/RNA helicase) [Rhodoplanes tepidamans]